MVLPIIKIFSRQKFDKAFYSLIRRGGVKLEGNPYFISDDIFLDDTDWSKITIEKNVTISRGVTILIHDFSVSRPIEEHESDVYRAYTIAPVSIKAGAFIGANVTILPGTEIGEDSIVGAGSVIKGEIPDNVVVAGNPARILKTNDEYYQSMREKAIIHRVYKK